MGTLLLLLTLPGCRFPPVHPITGFGGLFRNSLPMRLEARQAKAVYFGKVVAIRNEASGKEESDIAVTEVLISHPALDAKKAIKVDRAFPKESLNQELILFCDLHKGAIDVYRGFFTNAEVVGYFRNVVAMKEPDLAFFLEKLSSSDAAVAQDAIIEVGRITDAEMLKLGTKLKPELLRSRLRDAKTKTSLLDLYALLLGMGGRKEDIKFVRSLLDSTEVRYKDASRGLAAALVLLDPDAGIAHLKQVLAHSNIFTRIQALSVVRYYGENLPGKVAKGRLVPLLLPVLKQQDLADLAISGLERLKAWDKAPEVLAVAKKKWATTIPAVKRSLLYYCLSCEGSPEAKAHVAAMRKTDAEAVSEAEEILKQEAEAAKPKK